VCEENVFSQLMVAVYVHSNTSKYYEASRGFSAVVQLSVFGLQVLCCFQCQDADQQTQSSASASSANSCLVELIPW